MLISDDFELTDAVSGLRLKVIKGEKQDRLHIEHIGAPICNNRDFFFTKDGELDGTGSGV